MSDCDATHDVAAVGVNAKVPPGVVEGFDEKVRETYGRTGEIAGSVLEMELRAVFGQGELAAIEDAVDGVAPTSVSDDQRKKIPQVDHNRSDTVFVRRRIGEDLRDRIDELVNRDDTPYRSRSGFVTKIMWGYVDGGSASRIVSKLDRIESGDNAADSEDDAETSNKSVKERKTDAIVAELGDEFVDDALEAAIHEHAGRGDRASDPTVRKYREIVLEDRLDVKQLPDTSLYATSDEWLSMMAARVIGDLGGDSVDDTCPPFTKQSYSQALVENGIDVVAENYAEVNEIKDRLLTRLDFAFDDEREEFVPVEDAAETDTVTEVTDATETEDTEAEQHYTWVHKDTPREQLRINPTRVFEAAAEADQELPITLDAVRDRASDGVDTNGSPVVAYSARSPPAGRCIGIDLDRVYSVDTGELESA